MQSSVLLCISTLLDSGNHYSKMMEMRDSYGNLIFESIRITLVCDDCLKTGTQRPYALLAQQLTPALIICSCRRVRRSSRKVRSLPFPSNSIACLLR